MEAFAISDRKSLGPQCFFLRSLHLDYQWLPKLRPLDAARLKWDRINETLLCVCVLEANPRIDYRFSRPQQLEYPTPSLDAERLLYKRHSHMNLSFRRTQD